MSVHDARPGDIYVDEHGKLWRVVSYLDQPSVCIEAVEPHAAVGTMEPGKLYGQGDSAERVEFIRERKSGGVGGYMWHGFKRIFRPETDSATNS